MDKEIWKDIKGYEGLYQVSNLGRVRSLDRTVNYKDKSKALRKGRILKTHQYKCGYSRVVLWNENTYKNKSVHRLVAQAFIPNPDNKPFVNHIDGNKGNSCLNNLEWCDQSENMQHAYINRLVVKSKGELAHRAKFTNEQAKQIRKEYISWSREFGVPALAKKYGVNKRTILDIIHNKTYKE